MATTYMDPGTDATQDFSFWQDTGTSAGTIISDSSKSHTGLRSIKASTTSGGSNFAAYAASPDGVCSDAGTRISLWVYLSTAAPSTNLASGEPRRFKSLKTRALIPTEVAQSVAPINK